MLSSLCKLKLLLKRNYIKVKSLFFLFSLLLIFMMALVVIINDYPSSESVYNSDLDSTHNIQYLRNTNINSIELDTNIIEETINSNIE